MPMAGSWYGFRRGAWLTRECGTIALGLSLERTRGWFVMPHDARACGGPGD